MKYTAKQIDKDDKQSSFGKHLIEIYCENDSNITKIGSYIRNYHSFGESTFFPFEQNGQWYALYSKDYTATRIMKLPECLDIGGEEAHTHGFCPVEYFVPELVLRRLNPLDPEPKHFYADECKYVTKTNDNKGYIHYTYPEKGSKDYEEYTKIRNEHSENHEKWSKRNPFNVEYASFGFVAGCIWGDDSSWKVEFLDLSKVSQGIITRDNRFGYLELPNNVNLKNAIDTNSIHDDDPSRQYITIAVPVTYDITGKEIK